MRVITLEYHDVVSTGAWDQSGFPGAAANSYKLSAAAFEQHLNAISRLPLIAGRSIADVLTDPTFQSRDEILFTFDDGGACALTEIAPRLERRGWCGHFFVTTDQIGTPGFLTAHQLRELRARGHIVGTHSRSHPLRMSELTDDELEQEWRGSLETLSQILGEPVTIGSLPGGALSRTVAAAAERAGLRALFTSEPVVRTSAIGSCILIGRFTVRKNTSAALAAAVARGAPLPWMRQWAWWNMLKVAKAAGGPSYLMLRRWLFGIDGRNQLGE
jgi:peptidoglycan/xylan/chitin deacetylase (PgdA/CDA1 family)